MFRISRRLDYGIKLMVALAQDDENLPKSTSKIAKDLQIPLPFLHQIGHSLMQSGLIKATPGPKGGLRLNLPAENISILKITESLEGPICLNNCFEDGIEFEQDGNYSTQDMWSHMQSQIIGYLDGVSLNDLTRTNNSDRMPITSPFFSFVSDVK
jgi:Rrf2 family protein